VVRFEGMGGVCSSPRNGRFRIDRSKKGGAEVSSPRTAPVKKVRYCGGGAIGSATAAGSTVRSHRFFGQVDLRIFDFTDNEVYWLT